jgi:hypothetical protein
VTESCHVYFINYPGFLRGRNREIIDKIINSVLVEFPFSFSLCSSRVRTQVKCVQQCFLLKLHECHR